MENIYQEIELCVTQDNNDDLRKILLQNKNTELNNGDLYHLNPPLYRAATFGFNDICETLLANGADVNYTKDNIFYPLEGAASANKVDTACLLLRYGADINAYNLVRVSALGSACTEGHYEMVKYLIGKGADINRINIGLYMTPLDIATAWGHQPIVKLLKENGALSNINQNYDWSIEDAGGISAHIDYNIGRVLPNRFNIRENGTFYRIAVVNKNNNILLFSTGNYRFSDSSAEFIMVLPVGWNPYNTDLPSGLPYIIMDCLSLHLQGGHRFQDGDFISLHEICECSKMDYAGFYIIDYNYTKPESEQKNVDRKNETVTLFTLIPQKTKKNRQYHVTPGVLNKLKGGKWKSLEWKSVPVL